MAPRESIEQKALRYIQERRLTIERVDVHGGVIVARCKGSEGAEYMLGWDAITKEWRCQCLARGHCAHLTALQMVTVRP